MCDGATRKGNRLHHLPQTENSEKQGSCMHSVNDLIFPACPIQAAVVQQQLISFLHSRHKLSAAHFFTILDCCILIKHASLVPLCNLLQIERFS